MLYQVLMLDIPKDFCCSLKHKFQGMDVDLTMAITLLDAASLCAQQQFHLLLLSLSDDVTSYEYITTIRRISYAPII